MDSIGRYTFIRGDICDFDHVFQILKEYEIDTVVNFAAESHVDNSIKDPLLFSQTNILGTHTLLEACRLVWKEGSDNRFIQISTDEVYGSSLKEKLTEHSQLAPNSPYSASKASADLIVRSYVQTFQMNACITRCSNNYGPNQHEEKLIPLMIKKAIKEEKLPLYGTGLNVRDWIYVDDHCSAIDAVLHYGKKGEVYNVGSNNEKNNLSIVTFILHYLKKSQNLITFVPDRKGHDFRYAVDSSKLQKELNWRPKTSFEDGMKKTIAWYHEKDH